MPQLLSSSSDDRRVVVSCLVFDLRFDWRLEAAENGCATRISPPVTRSHLRSRLTPSRSDWR